MIVKKMDMLMIISLKVRRATMILTMKKIIVWAVKRMNMSMMTSKRKMMITIEVRKTEISMTTRKTPRTPLKPTIMTQNMPTLQEQQKSNINNAMIVLLLDLPELLQQYLLHLDLPETFLGGCLPAVTLLDTLQDTLTQILKKKSGRQQW